MEHSRHGQVGADSRRPVRTPTALVGDPDAAHCAPPAPCLGEAARSVSCTIDGNERQRGTRGGRTADESGHCWLLLPICIAALCWCVERTWGVSIAEATVRPPPVTGNELLESPAMSAYACVRWVCVSALWDGEVEKRQKRAAG
jgi:hypothetical protein